MFLNAESYKALKKAKRGAVHPSIEKAIKEGRLRFFKGGAYKYTPSENFGKKKEFPVNPEIQATKDSLKRIDKIASWLGKTDKVLVSISHNKAVFRERKRNVR